MSSKREFKDRSKQVRHLEASCDNVSDRFREQKDRTKRLSDDLTKTKSALAKSQGQVAALRDWISERVPKIYYGCREILSKTAKAAKAHDEAKIAEGRAEGIAEAAKAMCGNCNDGNEAKPHENMPPLFVHETELGLQSCSASAIWTEAREAKVRTCHKCRNGENVFRGEHEWVHGAHGKRERCPDSDMLDREAEDRKEKLE